MKELLEVYSSALKMPKRVSTLSTKQLCKAVKAICKYTEGREKLTVDNAVRLTRVVLDGPPPVTEQSANLSKEF